MSGPVGRFRFSERAAHLHERMDDPSCDTRLLYNTYRQFETINRLLCGWRTIYVRRLRPLMKGGGRFSLLDIGFGGGDIPRALARWAAADQLNLDITAVEQDPRALHYVRSLSASNGVRFLHTDTTNLLKQDQRFDFVVSNAVLHHLGTDQLPRFFSEVDQLAVRLVVLNDIARSPVAYALFTAFVAPCFRDSFAAEDGRLSIRRSYTRDELVALVPAGWQVTTMYPYRLVATYSK